MTEDRARQLVADARVAHLATLGPAPAPDGSGEVLWPHVVPICLAVEEETIYSAVDDKPKASWRLRRVQNLAASPRAAVLVDRYDEDWNRLWWIRADCEARLVERGEEHSHAVALLRSKYSQYRDQALKGPVIVLTVKRWAWWEWSEGSAGDG